MEVSGQGGMRVIEKPWIAISQEALSQKGEYQMLLNEKYWL
jgi:stage II sporulation protein GA (sporulation sigma-E factor processing peptidase)